MTIFDIKPYSYWRQRWRQEHDRWLVTFGDTPRTVLEVELLELTIARQKRMIDYLTRDNRELRSAHQLVLKEYLDLHAACMELHQLVTQTVQSNVLESGVKEPTP